jgi:deoxyadenosine/deoxycytidine kinase
MIVFINGSFGVGKTSVAEILSKRLPNSLVFDPEEVGFFLRDILDPIHQEDDFQDYSMWRSLVVTTAKLLCETYGRTLIMPMTLTRRSYFEEVVGGLSGIDPNLHHVCLTAPVDTIYSRLISRGDKPGSWTWTRVERCHDAFQSPIFNLRIPTENTLPDAVAETILTAIANQTARWSNRCDGEV